MVKISIIMPAFNVENYIERAVNSIIRQSFTNWELLIIDDGSSDRTGEISSYYAEGNPKIKYIKKQNGGQFQARKLGIKKAQGEYIGFVDADDWVHKDFISVMIANAENADVICTDIEYVYSNKEDKFAVIKDIKKIVYEYDSILQEWIMERQIDGYLCTKLIKAKYLKQLSELDNEPKFNFLEDVWLLNQFIKDCKKVVRIDLPLYYYYQRNASTIHSIGIDKKKYGLELNIDITEEFLQESNFKYCVAYRRKRAFMKLLSSFSLREIGENRRYLHKMLNEVSLDSDNHLHAGDKLVWQFCNIKLFGIAHVIRNSLLSLKRIGAF